MAKTVLESDKCRGCVRNGTAKRCDKCRTNAAKWMRNRYAKRKKKGLCPTCGEKAVKGFVYCTVHKRIRKNAYRIKKHGF